MNSYISHNRLKCLLNLSINILIAFILIFNQNMVQAQENILENPSWISTFSIVASDPEADELGISVASRFFAVGSVVPWAKADVGAVATQSFANTTFGWRGLELLDKGASPEEVVKILVRSDDDPEKRQFGIVSADGRSDTYTGKQCVSWAGGRHGPNYAVQGNILVGEAVVAAMEETFLQSKGTLAERIYAALVAGDKRAAIRVENNRRLF